MARNRYWHPFRIRRFAAATAALLVVIALTLTAPAAVHAEAVDEPFPSNVPPGYSLAWADEFDGMNADGTGLDESEWFYREGEKAECSNQPDNVTVGGGLLHIALEAEEAEGEAYTCGGVISNRWFGYGYYETRAKLWGDQGFHSAFWTTGLTAYIPDVPDYRGPHNRINEIDGFEIDSHAPDKVAYHSHWFVPEHVGNQGSLVAQADSSAAYHTYGFEWTPTEVRFYTDGVLKKTLPKAGTAWHPEHLADHTRLHRARRRDEPAGRDHVGLLPLLRSDRGRRRMSRPRRSSSTTAIRATPNRARGRTSSRMAGA